MVRLLSTIIERVGLAQFTAEQLKAMAEKFLK